jgi:sec-independent protein translocase protein TatB
MFNLDSWKLVVLALLAVFLFGPERLPKVISEIARFLVTVRTIARNATNDLSRELGTEVRLEDLHPRAFVRKHLLSEEDEQVLRRPVEDAYRQIVRQLDDAHHEVTAVTSTIADDRRRSAWDEPARRTEQLGSDDESAMPSQPGGPEPRYDADAT